MKIIEQEASVELYIYKIININSTISLETLLSYIPEEFRIKTYKYRQRKNQLQYLFGKLLLRKILLLHSYNINIMNNLSYNGYGKPYFSNTNIRFNLSHSYDYVVCGFSNEAEIGVDIELNRKIEVSYYTDIFKMINNCSDDSITSENILKYWTILESVLKASGTGLNYPFDKVYIKADQNKVHIDDKIWYYQYLIYDSKFHLSISSNKKINLKIRTISIEDLL
jgi:4'-phosphopantetheinyl transferase